MINVFHEAQEFREEFVVNGVRVRAFIRPTGAGLFRLGWEFFHNGEWVEESSREYGQ